MPAPCPTCRHAGPILADRTTCRAETTEALVAYVERAGELADVDVFEPCPVWSKRPNPAKVPMGLPW